MSEAELLLLFKRYLEGKEGAAAALAGRYRAAGDGAFADWLEDRLACLHKWFGERVLAHRPRPTPEG